MQIVFIMLEGLASEPGYMLLPEPVSAKQQQTMLLFASF